MGKYISKEFGGPVFLPRYRLAPQNPFPAAVVDALVSYLYLLHPSSSLHSPYTPSQIFIGGDSAGGGLTLSLIQVLLWFQTPNSDGSKKTIRWMGKHIELTLPKGLIIMSGWVDAARCLPSEDSCARGDYIPTPKQGSKSRYRQSEAWPADPPRTLFYADDTAITHPLVSPVMARGWEGCPPVWWCVGDECLRDSNLFFAHRLLTSFVPLQFEKYTNMPHVFPMILTRNPTSACSFKSIGKFIRDHLGKTPYEYRRVRIHPKTLGAEELPEEELLLGGMTVERLRGFMEREVGTWKRKVRGKEGEAV
ncbi:Alpha/Beta hydrolase protein [Terfezia claveryi]|nr:Alpha/Beta hydrolase protein [Terfezia claveryi]